MTHDRSRTVLEHMQEAMDIEGKGKLQGQELQKAVERFMGWIGVPDPRWGFHHVEWFGPDAPLKGSDYSIVPRYTWNAAYLVERELVARGLTKKYLAILVLELLGEERHDAYLAAGHLTDLDALDLSHATAPQRCRAALAAAHGQRRKRGEWTQRAELFARSIEEETRQAN